MLIRWPRLSARNRWSSIVATSRPARLPGRPFLFSEIGKIDPQAPREERLRQLAQFMTSPENGRLARTIVNRIWDRLLGRAIVFPVDMMDNPTLVRGLIGLPGRRSGRPSLRP